jgi:hypothetical protein
LQNAKEKYEIRNTKCENEASRLVRGSYWVGYTLSYRDVMGFGAVAAGVARQAAAGKVGLQSS